VYIGATHSKLVDVTPLITQTLPLGLLSGGVLSRTTGLGIAVTAGRGYARDSIGDLAHVTWTSANLTATANTTQYVYVTTGGVVTLGTTLPDVTQNVVLGRLLSGPSTILVIGDQGALNISNYLVNLDRLNRLGIGCLYVSGSVVSENASTARAVDITAGHYFYSSSERFPDAATAPTISLGYHVAGVPTLTSITQFPNTHYDNGTDLVTLTAGYFTKHMLYTSGDTSNV
jgi:hypothetical protein